MAAAVAELLTCSVCGAPYAWAGLGRMPGRCPPCRARRSGRVIAEPAVVRRESQRVEMEERATDAWARERAAEIKRRARTSA